MQKGPRQLDPDPESKNELKDFLSADALKVIKRNSLGLAAKIEQLQKTNARIGKLEDEVAALEQGRLPKGNKPFTVPFETSLWDTMQASEETRTWTVTVPEGSSLRETREFMYLSFLKKIRDMDLQLAKKQREDLRTTTKKSTFVDRCLETRSTHSELWKELDLELDVDDSDIKGMSVESLTAKATVIYKRTVDKAASSLKAKKDLETRKAAQRDRVLEQIVKKSPQDFLNEAIDQRIAAVSKAMPKPSQAVFRAPPGLPIDAASAFVSASSNAIMTKDDVAAFVEGAAEALVAGAEAVRKRQEQEQRQASGEAERASQLQLKTFLKWICGMPIPELQCLMQCGQGLRGLYTYSPAEKQAWVASPRDVPWPIEFVLRFHAKHVFTSRRLPSLASVSRALQQWEFKIRWRYEFNKLSVHETPLEETQQWWKLHDRHSTPPIGQNMPEQWEVFLHEAKLAAMKRFAASRSFFRDKRHLCSNLSPIARWGLKLLREGPLGAVKTDKDGGFTVVNKHELKEAVTSSLRGPQYQEIVVHEDLVTDMVQEYRNVCEMIRLHTRDNELSNALTSSLRRGGRDFACSVLTTVKTHKDPGQVSLRIIHAAPKHFMNPGMRWIGMHLKSFIATHPHILKDSDHSLSLCTPRPKGRVTSARVQGYLTRTIWCGMPTRGSCTSAETESQAH
ncbi:unnamed protein product [Symbiodinium sp. CCMP2592]|nr:unnamed protein product [Symbiodinium sp. CCMP2592]